MASQYFSQYITQFTYLCVWLFYNISPPTSTWITAENGAWVEFHRDMNEVQVWFHNGWTSNVADMEQQRQQSPKWQRDTAMRGVCKLKCQFRSIVESAGRILRTCVGPPLPSAFKMCSRACLLQMSGFDWAHKHGLLCKQTWDALLETSGNERSEMGSFIVFYFVFWKRARRERIWAPYSCGKLPKSMNE